MATAPVVTTDSFLRVAGVVAFTDGSVDSFCTVLMVGGQIYSHPNSNEIFNRLWQKKQAQVQAILNTVGTIVLTPDAPAISKGVADFTMEVIGHVTYTDGTHNTFGTIQQTSTAPPKAAAPAAQVIAQVHAETPTTTAFTKAVTAAPATASTAVAATASTVKANIKTALERVVGKGKVGI